MSEADDITSTWPGAAAVYLAVPAVFFGGVVFVATQSMSSADSPSVEARHSYRDNCRRRHSTRTCGEVIHTHDAFCVGDATRYRVTAGQRAFSRSDYLRCMRAREP